MKKIILLSLLIAFCHSIFSQELLFYAGGGFSGQKYKSEHSTNNIKLGGHLGISYNYYFTDKLGLATGLEFGLYRNKLSLENEHKYSANILDDLGETFEYRVNTTGYKESNHFTAIAIPLILQYRIEANQNFYINGGFKFILPQKLQVKADAEKINLSAYYQNEDLFIDDLPQHGFGVVTNWSDNLKLEQKFTVTLSLEAGMYFNIKENSRLYAGLYFDYGLTNMLKNTVSSEQNKPFIEYSPTGIENAKFNDKSGANIQKANLLAFGINVKYALRFKQKQKTESDIEEPEVQLVKNTTPEEKQKNATKKEPEKINTEKPKTKETTKLTEQAKVKKDVSKKPDNKIVKNKEVKTITPKENQITEDKKNKIEETELSVEGNKSGATKLSKQSKRNLDKVVEIMKKNKNIKLKIIGHTCNIGGNEENYRVGMKRANSVANYLISKGISRNRLKTVSKGETEPLKPNTSEANRQKNRRVELEVIQ